MDTRNGRGNAVVGKIRITNIEDLAEKVQVAHLLYERDDPFVPITPLAVLSKSTTFYKATINDGELVRAASSFEEWLLGCDKGTKSINCTVYELASSIVRAPMGGFESPSLQQMFAYVRLLSMLDSYV